MGIFKVVMGDTVSDSVSVLFTQIGNTGGAGSSKVDQFFIDTELLVESVVDVLKGKIVDWLLNHTPLAEILDDAFVRQIGCVIVLNGENVNIAFLRDFGSGVTIEPSYITSGEFKKHSRCITSTTADKPPRGKTKEVCWVDDAPFANTTQAPALLSDTRVLRTISDYNAYAINNTNIIESIDFDAVMKFEEVEVKWVRGNPSVIDSIRKLINILNRNWPKYVYQVREVMYRRLCEKLSMVKPVPDEDLIKVRFALILNKATNTLHFGTV